ncbi:CheF family chemotaxis protein [Halomicroarcula sp. F13]|uniref:CheF family chemotaxis protein n=1 Tax=Haloarcula rubra TaxID=2487747 RepID=A0AAW4PUE1_9EURY|nr:CheF family chemotaxis protein [Halomicroarcula rubra]MBX0324155.1 CheF family chemotaxis protein [Halomicroarcula rubra]
MSDRVEIPATVLCHALGDEPVATHLSLGSDTLGIEGDGFADELRLDNLFDVRVGAPPQAAASAFSGTVLTVGFERDGGREVLFVRTDPDTLTTFAGLLYRRLLDGEEVAVCHPAEIGGRVTDATYDIGRLHVVPDRVGVSDVRAPFDLELGMIVDFWRSTEELLGDRQQVIHIQYVRDGVAVSLDLALNPPRAQHLLGRHLQRKYVETRREIRGLDVPPVGVRALVRLYSLRGRMRPQSLADGESVSTSALVRALRRRGLIEPADGEVALTSRGWILVTEYVSQSGHGHETTDGTRQRAAGQTD